MLLYYYSTLAPFYHIRSRERAKYATVYTVKILIMYCPAKSRFPRFSGQRTGKPNCDVIFSSGIKISYSNSMA